MAEQTKAPKGGRKLRRHSLDAPHYKRQFFRTINNKIRRLRRRIHKFALHDNVDRGAEAALKRLLAA